MTKKCDRLEGVTWHQFDSEGNDVCHLHGFKDNKELRDFFDAQEIRNQKLRDYEAAYIALKPEILAYVKNVAGDVMAPTSVRNRAYEVLKLLGET